MNKATREHLEATVRALGRHIEQESAWQEEAQATADKHAANLAEAEAALKEIEADLKAA